MGSISPFSKAPLSCCVALPLIMKTCGSHGDSSDLLECQHRSHLPGAAPSLTKHGRGCRVGLLLMMLGRANIVSWTELCLSKSM